MQGHRQSRRISYPPPTLGLLKRFAKIMKVFQKYSPKYLIKKFSLKNLQQTFQKILQPVIKWADVSPLWTHWSPFGSVQGPKNSVVERWTVPVKSKMKFLAGSSMRIQIRLPHPPWILFFLQKIMLDSNEPATELVRHCRISPTHRTWSITAESRFGVRVTLTANPQPNVLTCGQPAADPRKSTCTCSGLVTATADSLRSPGLPKGSPRTIPLRIRGDLFW